MSKVKLPDEKKRLSLGLDGRNSFRENSKASRKGIPRAKSRSRRDERRSVAQVLSAAAPQAHEELDRIEAQARSKSRVKKLAAFKKVPDGPLGAHIERQGNRRKRRGIST